MGGPTFDRVAELPLRIDSYELEGLSLQLGPEFERLTTVIHLHGGGEEGIGEDVTYTALDHIALQDAGPILPLKGEWTFAQFSDHLGKLDLFPSPPERDDFRSYRRWGFESAALDLALRQAGQSLAEAVGREAKPVTFVVSMRLAPFHSDEPSSIEPLQKRLDVYPDLRFKLDPTNDWDDDLIAAIEETGAVDSLDLKGFYRDTPVDVETDPELYAKLIEVFPDAWLEDPDVTEETRPILEPVAERVTWDAPIHSVGDIEDRPWKPKMINIKPSRFGSVKALFEAYDHCEANGIGAYGGGQTELGQGRGQIQYLASVFHPDTPNDVAPSGFNDPQAATRPGLPTSPLDPVLTETGFRWGS